MKPDWKDAPEWANWLAMDSDGKWFWHEEKPRPRSSFWDSTGAIAELHFEFWKETIQERPQ